jgi:2-(1,2-epoxy-1,2-dihydrophenyl)acetyl-CoA isomerase
MVVTLNRPTALNAFNEAQHLALRKALDDIEADQTVRCLILTGSGRAFCSGQDLADRRRSQGDEAPDLGKSLGEFYNPLIRRLYGLKIPTIAAVNGVAAGAGANIALACDLVIAAQSARFIQAFSRVGLGPDAGGSYFLPRAIGLARAKALMLTGEPLGADEAAQWGLIWKAVPDDELMTTARELAEKLSTGPTLALAAIRDVLHQSLDNSLDEQLDLERDTQRELGRSRDYREGIEAFFEKRKPTFKGK